MSYKYNELFNNRDKADLDRTNDLFDVIDKGDAIVKVLQNTDQLEGNNMLALYGEWGGGKTSLMKYIIRELTTPVKEVRINEFKTIFFEAWKYEKEQNLALSLLEQIIMDMANDNELNEYEQPLKEIGKTLLCFAKNMLLNSKVDVFGIEFELGKAGKETIHEMNKENEKVSLYYEFERFKEQFKSLEVLIMKKYSHVVIFIDDLDRCEPENVLNLLSSIKLFFIRNENFIYFSGVDKEAVKKSVDLKYNSIIKSNEYLEKIFDITFNMPEVTDFNRILKLYFKNSNVKDANGINYKYLKSINEFFCEIGLKNPRHIKKVFNKFELLRRFKNISDDKQFPNIDNDENIILIIVTLYLIVLHEYHKDKFDDLLNYEKFYSLYEFKEKKDEAFNITNTHSVGIKEVANNLSKGSSYISYDCIRQFSNKDGMNNLFYIVMFFLPKIEKEYRIVPGISYDETKNTGVHNMIEFINQFSNTNSTLQIGFVKYLIHMNYNIETYNSLEKPTSLKILIKYLKLYM